MLQIFSHADTLSGFLTTSIFILHKNIHAAHVVTLSGVFFSAIEYIIFLHQQRKKQEEELEALRKEVMALKIMKT